MRITTILSLLLVVFSSCNRDRYTGDQETPNPLEEEITYPTVSQGVTKTYLLEYLAENGLDVEKSGKGANLDELNALPFMQISDEGKRFYGHYVRLNSAGEPNEKFRLTINEHPMYSNFMGLYWEVHKNPPLLNLMWFDPRNNMLQGRIANLMQPYSYCRLDEEGTLLTQTYIDIQSGETNVTHFKKVSPIVTQ